MDSAMPTPRRALDRLRQLAREERAAVLLGDVDAICFIASQLPEATRVLERAGTDGLEDAPEVIAEIQACHASAEAFLERRMDEVRSRLRQCTNGRKTLRGYQQLFARRRSRLNDAG